MAGVTTEENALVLRAKAGDREAFAEIFRHYRPRIHAHCYNILRNTADADDLTQETFCKAYSALQRTTETLALSAWLYRIASNACTDLLRRRQTARWLPLDEHCHERPSVQREDNPETAFLDTEALQRFGATCGAMSPRNRRALTLRAKDGLSVEQIGAHLGITTPAVKSLLFRARGEYRGLAEEGTAASARVRLGSPAHAPDAPTPPCSGIIALISLHGNTILPTRQPPSYGDTTRPLSAE